MPKRKINARITPRKTIEAGEKEKIYADFSRNSANVTVFSFLPINTSVFSKAHFVAFEMKD
jgi:hypothetical protein